MHRSDEILEEIRRKLEILKSKEIDPNVIYLGKEELSHLVCNSMASSGVILNVGDGINNSFEIFGLRILVVKADGHISVGI